MKVMKEKSNSRSASSNHSETESEGSNLKNSKADTFEKYLNKLRDNLQKKVIIKDRSPILTERDKKLPVFKPIRRCRFEGSASTRNIPGLQFFSDKKISFRNDIKADKGRGIFQSQKHIITRIESGKLNLIKKIKSSIKENYSQKIRILSVH